MPIEALDAPSLFMTRLDGTLRDIIEGKVYLPMAEGLEVDEL